MKRTLEQMIAEADNAVVNKESIMCNCGKEAIKRTVKKEGPNKGRVFYMCCKSDDDPSGCVKSGKKFFKWEDEPEKQQLFPPKARFNAMHDSIYEEQDLKDMTNGQVFPTFEPNDREKMKEALKNTLEKENIIHIPSSTYDSVYRYVDGYIQFKMEGTIYEYHVLPRRKDEIWLPFHGAHPENSLKKEDLGPILGSTCKFIVVDDFTTFYFFRRTDLKKYMTEWRLETDGDDSVKYSPHEILKRTTLAELKEKIEKIKVIAK